MLSFSSRQGQRRPATRSNRPARRTELQPCPELLEGRELLSAVGGRVIQPMTHYQTVRFSVAMFAQLRR